MRGAVFFISSLLLMSSLFLACNSALPEDQDDEVEAATQTESSAYDAKKATAYGADDYGMRQYVMAFLRKGPNRDLDSLKAAALQMAHLENIGRLAEAGKLTLAGPFLGDGDLRGIYIFNVSTVEEAKALTKTDPAIQAGSLEMELLEWYGSAALMAVNDLHLTLAKKSVME